MVKEFQQLRKQMTQILFDNQTQQQTIKRLINEQEEEKKDLFLALIRIIESLDKKEKIHIRALKLKTVSEQDLPEIYSNIKNKLIALLTKYDVHPLSEEVTYGQIEFNSKNSIKEGGIYPKTKYSYRGKILDV